MRHFYIRFFIDTLAIDDFVKASSLAEAVGEAHSKLSGKIFYITDIQGNTGTMIESARVDHITVIEWKDF